MASYTNYHFWGRLPPLLLHILFSQIRFVLRMLLGGLANWCCQNDAYWLLLWGL